MKNAFYALLSMFFSCFKPQSATKQTTVMPPDPERFQHYAGSLYKNNYVWSGAMNLCWTELCQSVIRAPITLRTNDTAALRMADCFNHPVCTKADLDAPSYYTKAGFGPRTLEAINRESRAKFPEKSFPDLKIDLRDEDIISYACFYKKVAYEMPFTRREVFFDGRKVAGFEADSDQKRTVEVLHYENDARFVLRLRLKDPADELILAKGFDTRQPEELLRQLEQLNDRKGTRLTENDFFKMPLLSLQCRREYDEMTGKNLDNEGFKQYFIGQMFENIAFELDETGARVESQAVISVERSQAAHQRQKRYFYLDKPFWVLMKRTDAHNPYFLLGVNNTEIMQTL